jgi:hypothetical protein
LNARAVYKNAKVAIVTIAKAIGKAIPLIWEAVMDVPGIARALGLAM